MAEPAISLDEVTRTFGPTLAVDAVSFAVQPGEVFGILGHNGAGKTTLIRLINGLLRPTSGRLRVLGMDPVDHGEHVRRRTGVLTEYPALDHFLTVGENLHVYASIHGVADTHRAHAVQRILQQLGLSDRVDVPAHALSAGLKQRVALGRALIHDPDLLLLDEPTSNLDPMAGRRVRDLVTHFARELGRTVVLSTHNLVEAEQLCDRVAIVRHGRVLACGDLTALSDSQRGPVAISTDPAHVHALRGVLDRHTGGRAEPDADGVTVRAPLRHDAVPTVVSALVASEIPIHAVRPQRPSLEDVYMSLHDSATPELARSRTS